MPVGRSICRPPHGTRWEAALGRELFVVMELQLRKMGATLAENAKPMVAGF